MNYELGPVLESEDNMTLGRAVAIAAWRLERKRTRNGPRFAYDIDRLRRELASLEYTDLQMIDEGKYARLTFDITEEVKAHAPSLSSDYALKHPFYACSRIVSEPEAGFVRLGEIVREVLFSGKRDVRELVAHLASVVRN